MNAAEANQAYGALTAEFYLAGFTFERAMGRTLRLLGSGAWKDVGDGFDDVNEFVRSLGLDKFRVIADQRKEFRERVKALAPKVSNRAIADALGVGSRTIDRDAAPFGAADARKPAKSRKGRASIDAAGGMSCTIPGCERPGWGARDEPNDSTILFVCFADTPDLDENTWARVRALDCLWAPFPALREWFWREDGERRWERQHNGQANGSISHKIPIAEILTEFPEAARFVIWADGTAHCLWPLPRLL